MPTNNIDICGITPKYNLPRYSCRYPCKEICETHKLCIPHCKPEIESILQVFIDISIKKSTILDTPMGKKLAVYGDIHLKVLYVAKTSCQSVHSAHFDLPFCTFIMLGNTTREITDICLFIEDAFITQLDSNNFSISMLILVYPLLNKKTNSFNSNNYCDKSYHTDNVKSNSFNYINNCTNKDENYTIPSDSLTNIKNETQLYEDTNASLNTNSNQSFGIEYDNNTDFHDIDCEINQNNDLDIEYDMNQNNITSVDNEYIMDYEDCIDSKLICEDEYFENEWK